MSPSQTVLVSIIEQKLNFFHATRYPCSHELTEMTSCCYAAFLKWKMEYSFIYLLITKTFKLQYVLHNNTTNKYKESALSDR